MRAKVRREYDTHRLEADPEKVTFLLRLAETQLESARPAMTSTTTLTVTMTPEKTLPFKTHPHQFTIWRMRRKPLLLLLNLSEFLLVTD